MNSGAASYPFLIPQLDPGAIVTQSVPFDTIQAVAEQDVAVSSTARLPSGISDRNLPNNTLQSVVTYRPTPDDSEPTVTEAQ